MTLRLPSLRANNSTIRQLEADSIREFLIDVDRVFAGAKVLDYGCGDQRYRDIIEGAGGDYHGWNRAELPGTPHRVDVGPDEPLSKPWGAIVCTQVIQYVPDVPELLERFRAALNGSALPMLVLTYPTNWDEVEPADLHRFTFSGIERLLAGADFTIAVHYRRAQVELGGFKFPLGGGVVARARGGTNG